MQSPHLHHHEKQRMDNYIVTNTTDDESLQHKRFLVMVYYHNALLVKSALKIDTPVSYRLDPDPSAGPASSSSDLGRSFLPNPFAVYDSTILTSTFRYISREQGTCAN